MSEEKSGSPEIVLDPENSEIVNQIAIEIMEPAIQKAIKDARGKGSPMEIMSALANAYAGFLVELLGHRAASSLMRGHSDHIASREQSKATD